MDGRTLMDIMQSPNFAMWGPAEQAFNQSQQKEKANLASIMGQEQRAQAMHPLEMQSKEVNNRLNASSAGLNEYSLKSKVDPEQAKKAAMQKMLGEMDDTTRGQFKQQVTRNMQIAAMAKANGGALPPGIQMSPEEIQMFSPGNLDKIIQHGQTFLGFDPEEIAKRQRAKEAESLAKVRGQVQMDVKGTPSDGGSKGGPSMAPPKMNLEQQMGYYNNLAFAEKDEAKKKMYQAEADRLELMIYRKQIEAAKARQAGQVDPSQLGGGLPVYPPVNPTATPRTESWAPPPGWKIN